MKSPSQLGMSDWQHTSAATRDAAISERIQGWIDPQTAAIHSCLRRCLSGNVLWTLWSVTSADGAARRYIACDELVANRVGWSYRSFMECNGLAHVSCPLSFLDDAPVVSNSWRRAVATHWRGEAAPLLAAPIQTTRWVAGEPVRYEGPRTATLTPGQRGVVIHVSGQTGTVHPDALRRTTCIRWTDGHEEAVFNIHLRR